MPIYKVIVDVKQELEIQAENEEQASEYALQELGECSEWIGDLDTEITLADSQYSAQDELKDRESRAWEYIVLVLN